MLHVRHDAAMLCFGVLLVCVSGVTQAASLGKIEVTTPLGKPLYAEVPLQLKSNELASKVFIEIAAPADYKIFEVYRDPVLNSIRADVASDTRGARVKLTSRVALQSPFFNLVLKVRYGRVSHFKKYAVFLDAAKPIARIANQTPVPHAEVIPSVEAHTRKPASVSAESAGQVLITKQDVLAATDMQAAQHPTVYQGWARTEKYGPIVRGDSLSIVAQRLRVDQRYSSSQIMVGLFEKNKTSFNQNNLNLIKANSFLQVPSAEEVEQHSKSEAYRIILEHRKAWKNEPRYAAESEVQRQRYSPRVGMGERAEGQVDASNTQQKNIQNDAGSVAASLTQDLLKPEKTLQSNQIKPAAAIEAVASEEANVAVASVSPKFKVLMQAQNETNQLLKALQQKNEQLQQQLIANKGSVDALNAKVDEGAAAASNARVEKLELLMTRLQAELEKQTRQPAKATVERLDWVTWALLSLLIIMLGVIAMLMRKEPVHPSTVEHDVAQGTTASDHETEPAVTTGPEAAVDDLEEAVEKEVDAIETDDQEVSLAKATGTFDALAVFTDELSDTDTAELEPFDVDAKQELDPNVDYVSEADVYIRYGMDEEALQQLDMALRLNPEHAEAHLKKVEVLHSGEDKQAFIAAFSAATLVLGATALDQYKASVEAFGGDVNAAPERLEQSQQSELPMVEGVDTVAPVTMAIDDSEIDALDFNLDGLNVSPEEPDGQEAAGVVSDQGNDSDGLDDLDWLSDPVFDHSEAVDLSDEQASDAIKDQGDIETIAVASGAFDLNAASDASELLTTGAATQQLDALLGEFADSEGASEEAMDAGLANEGKDNLDGLLSEFTEPDDVEADLLHLSAADQDSFDLGATQRLDSLLDEISRDDDLSFIDSNMAVDPAALEPSKSLSTSEEDDVTSLAMDVDYGATQHLGHLLNEFADDDDLSLPDSSTDMDSVALEPTKASSTAEEDDVTSLAMDAHHGATQELDSLLAEFSDDDDFSFLESSDIAAPQARPTIDMDVDHGATQELNTLLVEFAEDTGPEGQDDVDHGATQVLGHLLNEFSDDEDDNKKS